MYYIKYDTNRNNTILEYSKTPIIDIGAGQVTGTTTYEFPTSQPAIYYRWNGADVEGNSEDAINYYREEEGVLEGLDLEPYINSVIGGDFLPDTTKEIVILGENFSQFTTIEISGDGNFVNTTYFDTPKQLRADVTVNSVEGIYDLIAYNSELSSQSSGYGKIVIKSKTSIDFRTTPIGDLGLDMTSGISAEQDSEKGISFGASKASWNRGALLTSYFWNRADDHTFEIIFTKEEDVNFMIGIASASLDVSSINSAYYKQDIGMYHNNNKLASMYGGGDVSKWSQNIGTNIMFVSGKFYKLKLENSGSNGARCSIWEVNVDDWDDEIELHSWDSTCPADDEVLVPFVLPQASSSTYYITGIRY